MSRSRNPRDTNATPPVAISRPALSGPPPFDFSHSNAKIEGFLQSFPLNALAFNAFVQMHLKPPFSLLAALALLAIAARPAVAAPAKVDYNRDIRPILAENCTQCHGPDEEQR